MRKSVRSVVTTGVAIITAASIVVVPSVKEPQPPTGPAAAITTARLAAPPVQLAASVQPLLTTTSLPSLLVEWVDRFVVPPSASAPFPTPQFPPVVSGNSIGSVIENTYNAVEPWVQWGFELVAYGVGWIPYVGWLAPQVMIFYNLGERIVRSITFNIADWLDGDISFVQGLVNVGVDTINSFIFFANDQLAFWLPPLPPIPPLPSIFSPFAAETTTADLMMATTVEETTEARLAGQVEETIEAVEPEAATEEFVAEDDATVVEEAVLEEAATEEAVVEEAVVEEGEAGATETELSIETAAEPEANEPTTTSSATVQAQGEVRDAGVGVAPDEKTAQPEGPSDADEPDEADVAEAGTTPQPQSHDDEPNPDNDDAEAE